jgi:hypothetical protein
LETEAQVELKPVKVYLVGMREAEADGFCASGDTPILSLCRRLIDAGYDPQCPVHVHRGDALAMTISSLGYGARLRVKERNDGRPVFAPFIAPLNRVIASQGASAHEAAR